MKIIKKIEFYVAFLFFSCCIFTDIKSSDIDLKSAAMFAGCMSIVSGVFIFKLLKIIDKKNELIRQKEVVNDRMEGLMNNVFEEFINEGSIRDDRLQVIKSNYELRKGQFNRLY